MQAAGAGGGSGAASQVRDTSALHPQRRQSHSFYCNKMQEKRGASLRRAWGPVAKPLIFMVGVGVGCLFVPCGGILGSTGQAIVMDVANATDGMILAVSLKWISFQGTFLPLP